MKRAKQIAVKMAVITFMVLALCTVAAYRIEALLMDEVWSMEVPVSNPGAKKKIPSACVYIDDLGEPYVMVLNVRRGMWGMEEYVEKKKVKIREKDYLYCELEETDLEGSKLAIYPSRDLVDYEVVRCIGECK